MGWYWNPVAVGGLVAVTLAWTAALVVHFAAPRTSANRLLAIALFAEGLVYGTGNGLLYLVDDVRDGYALQALGFYGAAVFLWTYLLFIGTIPTPLTRWLRTRAARIGAIVGLVAHLVAYVFWRDLFIAGMSTAAYARVEGVMGPGVAVMFATILLMSLFALVCAIHAWHRAAPGPARERSRWYMIAFGVRDGAIATIILLDLTGAWPLASAIGVPFAIILFVPLLAYGVLRAQLFDIDLRIKWTIRRGTLVGVVAVAFVVVAEIAQNYLSDAYGYAVGGAAAGALLLAFRPLDRLSSRVADAAMPRVQATPDYVAFRKMEVYRAAVEGAMQDGEVTSKEREILRRLRDSLGIGEADAQAMERDLAAPA